MISAPPRRGGQTRMEPKPNTGLPAAKQPRNNKGSLADMPTPTQNSHARDNGHDPGPSLQDLIGLPTLKTIVDDFALATDMATAWVDTGGNIVYGARDGTLCTNFICWSQAGLERCRAGAETAWQANGGSGESVTFRCHAGLTCSIMGVRLNGRLLGFVSAGQVFTEAPRRDQARRYARELSLDPDKYWDAARQTPVISKEKVESVARMLRFLGRGLTRLALAGLNLAKANENKTEPQIPNSCGDFKAIVEALPDMMFVADSQGVLLDYKASAEDRTGMETDSFVGAPLRDILPKRLADSCLAHMPGVLRTGSPKLFEYQLTSPGAGVRSYEARMAKSGKDRIVAVVRDITGLRRAENKLYEANQRLRIAMKSADLGKWEYDCVTDRTEYDEHAARILGYNEETLVRNVHWWFDRIHPKDQRAVYAATDRCFSGRSNFFKVEYRLRRRDGSYFWALSNGFVIRRDQDGAPILFIGLLQDITQSKNQEKELLLKNKGLGMLNHCRDIIARSGDERELMLGICEALSDFGGYPGVRVDLTVRKENGALGPIVSCVLDRNTRPPAIRIGGDGEPALLPALAAMRTLEPSLALTGGKEPHLAPWRHDAAKLGCTSAMAFPLLQNGVCLGALTLLSNADAPFREAECGYLEQAARDMASAINSLRAKRRSERAEAALRESESRFRQVMENLPKIALSLRPDQTIEYANRYFLELTGWTRDEIIGENYFDLFLPERTREPMRASFERMMSEENSLDLRTMENQVLLKDNSTRLVRWATVLTRNDQGGVFTMTCLGLEA